MPFILGHSHSLDSFDRDVELLGTQMRMAYYFLFIILDVHISGGTLMRMAFYFSFNYSGSRASKFFLADRPLSSNQKYNNV